MRSESDIRDRLAMELMGATTHESPESHAARAAEERIRLLEWCLASPTESPPSGNGASE